MGMELLKGSNLELMVLKQGAEGRLLKGTYLKKPVIVKERFVKRYRHPRLDEALTKERMKAEARSITRCKEAGILTPALYLVDLKRRCIFMEEIEDCKTAKEYINEAGCSANMEVESLLREIGLTIAKMHRNNIIHGDLTTSNILVDSKRRVYIIDFGLSQSSQSVEDKAVDLYVLERALISTHSDSDNLFQTVIKSYTSSPMHTKSNDVIKRLNEVRARGRKRTMVG